MQRGHLDSQCAWTAGGLPGCLHSHANSSRRPAHFLDSIPCRCHKLTTRRTYYGTSTACIFTHSTSKNPWAHVIRPLPCPTPDLTRARATWGASVLALLCTPLHLPAFSHAEPTVGTGTCTRRQDGTSRGASPPRPSNLHALHLKTGSLRKCRQLILVTYRILHVPCTTRGTRKQTHKSLRCSSRSFPHPHAPLPLLARNAPFHLRPFRNPTFMRPYTSDPLRSPSPVHAQV